MLTVQKQLLAWMAAVLPLARAARVFPLLLLMRRQLTIPMRTKLWAWPMAMTLRRTGQRQAVAAGRLANPQQLLLPPLQPLRSSPLFGQLLLRMRKRRRLARLEAAGLQRAVPAGKVPLAALPLAAAAH